MNDSSLHFFVDETSRKPLDTIRCTTQLHAWPAPTRRSNDARGVGSRVVLGSNQLNDVWLLDLATFLVGCAHVAM
jgi:hypothetical protein